MYGPLRSYRPATGQASSQLTHPARCPSLALRPAERRPQMGRSTPQRMPTDPLGAAPGRVREGFVEVLEMGTIPRESALDRAVNHIVGIPSCNLGSEAAIAAALDPPSGKLYGSLTLVNVLEGTAYEYDATALDQWSGAVTYTAPGTYRPTLADATPAVSSVVAGGKLLVSKWLTGVDAVNAVLAAGSTQAEFMRDASVDGATDIVYAMPTKPLMVTPSLALPPFYVPLSGNGACEPSGDMTLNREEQAYPRTSSTGPYAGLCWVTTVQSLNAQWPSPSAVLGSRAVLRHFSATTETLSRAEHLSRGSREPELYGKHHHSCSCTPSDRCYDHHRPRDRSSDHEQQRHLPRAAGHWSHHDAIRERCRTRWRSRHPVELWCRQYREDVH